MNVQLIIDVILPVLASMGSGIQSSPSESESEPLVPSTAMSAPNSSLKYIDNVS